MPCKSEYYQFKDRARSHLRVEEFHFVFLVNRATLGSSTEQCPYFRWENASWKKRTIVSRFEDKHLTANAVRLSLLLREKKWRLSAVPNTGSTSFSRFSSSPCRTTRGICSFRTESLSRNLSTCYQRNRLSIPKLCCRYANNVAVVGAAEHGIYMTCHSDSDTRHMSGLWPPRESCIKGKIETLLCVALWLGPWLH